MINHETRGDVKLQLEFGENMDTQEKNKNIVADRQDKLPLSIITTDVNLSRLPFFALNRKGLKDELEREWHFSAVRGNERLDLVLNSLYVKPLDFPYWNSLRSDIARRLYEYLSFVSFATKCKPFSIEYHKLCNQLPSTPQRYFSLAKRCLKTAHQELMKTGFLTKVVWRKSKTDPKKWIIEYHFGMRAKAELQRGFKDDTYRPAIMAVETAEIGEIEAIIEAEEKEKGRKRKKQTPEEEVFAPIAQELLERGITKSTAIDFAEHFPEEYLREKIELHDVNRATGMLTQNAAGWLREAITRDFKLSEEQKQKLARVEKIKAEEQVNAHLEEQAKEIQEQRLKEALAHFPSEEEWVSARVEGHIKVREEMRKFDPTRPSFTEAEIEAYRQDYQEKFPQTDDERRHWLIQNETKYNLRNIISELAEQQEVKVSDLSEKGRVT